jgi:hypothetical protein
MNSSVAPKLYYATYLNCKSGLIHTIDIYVPDSWEARLWFHMQLGSLLNFILLSIWSAEDIERWFNNNEWCPPEVLTYLGYMHDESPSEEKDFNYKNDEDEEDDMDSGEEWKKLLD